MIRTKSKSEKTLSVLIKELDDVFALWVKLNAAEPSTGIVTCFVTGVRGYYKGFDAAHFHSRNHMGTRWNEFNVHPCTVESNRFNGRHLEMYAAAMGSRYCSSALAQLSDDARSLAKFTRPELQEKIDSYKEKVKELRKQKGL